MSTLTVRLPEDTAERFKSLARSRGLSVNKLVEEMSAQALAAQGDVQQALAILDRLDAGTKQTIPPVNHQVCPFIPSIAAKIGNQMEAPLA